MPKRKLPPDADVIRMYDSGMSSGEIAEQCGVKAVTVLSLLARIGHKRRTTQEAAILCAANGRKPPTRYWLGKTQPREMVESRVSKIRGPKHYLWKGGESRRQYRNVKDKEKCEECGGKLNLSFHHRDYDHYNDAPDNLAVLCVGCHMGLHKADYWEAKRNGKTPRKSNGPVGWKRGTGK